MDKKNLLKTLFLILIVGISRLIPHWPNFTAIGASVICLNFAWPHRNFSFTSKSVLVPLSALFISDMILGFHDQMIWVYGAVILNAFVCQKISVELKAKSLFQSAILTSILFYLITNFGFWYSMNVYAKSFSGLMETYIAALPFFKYELAGNLFYSALGIAILQKVNSLSFANASLQNKG